MRLVFRISLALALLIGGALTPMLTPAAAASTTAAATALAPDAPGAPLAPMACDPDKTQASGAVYRICMPVFWSRDLLVYAHGYVAPNKPIAIPEDQLVLPGGASVIDAANRLGYAFATTSYSVNGLAVPQALADLTDLVRIFRAEHPTVRRVFIVGVSEGGLITTLATEQFPNVFTGGMAGCGPIGDFRGQLGYMGNFRVVFDYFFPGLMPGTPVAIPPEQIPADSTAGWDAFFAARIAPELIKPSSAISLTQLLAVTHAPYDPSDPAATTMYSINKLLWYSMYATNDATAKLGGQPLGNQDTVYTGSLNDAALNAGVARFTADPAALAAIEATYQTTGRPRVSLVTIHTTLDEQVPYWHEELYRQKVVAANMTPRHDLIKVERYGHCNFAEADVVQALTLLQTRVSNPPKWHVFLPMVRRR